MLNSYNLPGIVWGAASKADLGSHPDPVAFFLSVLGASHLGGFSFLTCNIRTTLAPASEWLSGLKVKKWIKYIMLNKIHKCLLAFSSSQIIIEGSRIRATIENGQPAP